MYVYVRINLVSVDSARGSDIFCHIVISKFKFPQVITYLLSTRVRPCNFLGTKILLCIIKWGKFFGRFFGPLISR